MICKSKRVKEEVLNFFLIFFKKGIDISERIVYNSSCRKAM